MNEHRFTAEVARHARDASAAKELWSSATTSLQERVYTTPGGVVRVKAGWEPLVSEEDVIRIELTVIDENGHLAPQDVPSFVELFFYDAFLLFNIAVPGSFSGAVTVSGGELRVNELTFDAAPFAAGVSTVVRLSDVVGWYRGGTEQIASTPMQAVLFHLLHIGCGPADEWTLRARLDACMKELGFGEPSFEGAPVIHPMHDEALDEGLDDSAMEPIDQAMVRVLTAVQQTVRG
jgi:hypothetical protein